MSKKMKNTHPANRNPAEFHTLAPLIAERLGSLEAAALAYFIAHRANLHQERELRKRHKTVETKEAIMDMLKPWEFYHTLDAFVRDLPYLSKSAIRKYIKLIEEKEVLKVSHKNPKAKYDRQHRFHLSQRYNDNQIAPQKGTFKFYVTHAQKYGVLAAVLLNHIEYLTKDKRRKGLTEAERTGGIYVRLYPTQLANSLFVTRQTLTRALAKLLMTTAEDGSVTPGVLLRQQRPNGKAYYRMHPGLENGGIVPDDQQFGVVPAITP